MLGQSVDKHAIENSVTKFLWVLHVRISCDKYICQLSRGHVVIDTQARELANNKPVKILSGKSTYTLTVHVAFLWDAPLQHPQIRWRLSPSCAPYDQAFLSSRWSLCDKLEGFVRVARMRKLDWVAVHRFLVVFCLLPTSVSSLQLVSLQDRSGNGHPRPWFIAVCLYNVYVCVVLPTSQEAVEN